MRSTAELYDWELLHVHHRVDQDVGFYRGLAVALGGPVLELGCGTGRVAAPLVRAGVDVVGLDIDAAMLRVARARGVDNVVHGDMRRFAFTERFAVVAIPYNSLQLLGDDADVVACLRAAADHVAAHGMVAFEVTDFPGGDEDVENELIADEEGVRLIGSLRRDGNLLHYARRFEADNDVYEDVLTLRRDGASSALRWVEETGLKLVSADWVGLGLRVTARTAAPLTEL